MSRVHSEDRHPNGTPKTVHHWEEDGPVFDHEVTPYKVEDLVALGHPKAEAQAMRNEAIDKGKAAPAKS